MKKKFSSVQSHKGENLPLIKFQIIIFFYIILLCYCLPNKT